MAKHINRIKPYLFALVRAENSSAENRVRPALRNLDLIVCDQLVLNYEYDGTKVLRQDAVCYIVWFPLGRQLAQFLSVPPLSDAFTMLLHRLGR